MMNVYTSPFTLTTFGFFLRCCIASYVWIQAWYRCRPSSWIPNLKKLPAPKKENSLDVSFVFFFFFGILLEFSIPHTFCATRLISDLLDKQLSSRFIMLTSILHASSGATLMEYLQYKTNWIVPTRPLRTLPPIFIKKKKHMMRGLPIRLIWSLSKRFHSKIERYFLIVKGWCIVRPMSFILILNAFHFPNRCLYLITGRNIPFAFYTQWDPPFRDREKRQNFTTEIEFHEISQFKI